MTTPLNVLVIEDEPLIAMMIEDFIEILDHKFVGSVDSNADGVSRVGAGDFDVAILDVNLRDGPCWPVADALVAAGKPFVLATGGHVTPPPAEHADRPQLAKPFTMEGVRVALEKVGSTL